MTLDDGPSSAPVLAVLDYGIGNLRSAQKALQKVGADARLTADPEVVAIADGVVLPGVGALAGASRHWGTLAYGPQRSTRRPWRPPEPEGRFSVSVWAFRCSTRGAPRPPACPA